MSREAFLRDTSEPAGASPTTEPPSARQHHHRHGRTSVALQLRRLTAAPGQRMSTPAKAATILRRQLFGDKASESFGLPGVLLFLAVWLAVTAFGLRRGSPMAYRLSLAGMLFRMLCLVAASVFATGAADVAFTATASDNAFTLAARAATWTVLSIVGNGTGAVVVAGLVLTTIGFLLAKASRRFFIDRIRPGEFPPSSR